VTRYALMGTLISLRSRGAGGPPAKNDDRELSIYISLLGNASHCHRIEKPPEA
jgi:hypothetical protein